MKYADNTATKECEECYAILKKDMCEGCKVSALQFFIGFYGVVTLAAVVAVIVVHIWLRSRGVL